MNIRFLLPTLLLTLGCWALPLSTQAQDEGDSISETADIKKNKKKKTKRKAAREAKKASVIGNLLSEAEYLTDARPNPEAEFYIILYSASWCGPCRAEMPKIAKEYAEIAATGKVELVLFSADRTPDAAINFVSSNNGNFPIIAKNKFPQLPNVPQMQGIPAASFYKADGTLITNGHGSMVMQWREHTIDKADAGDDGEPPSVGEALKKVKFVSGKPSVKADYYIFLHSASWCGPCRAIMPDIAKEYKKLKRAKIELILVSGDKTEDEAKEYVKHYKAKFPAAMPSEFGSVPGYSGAPAYPHAFIVDKYGRQLTHGNGKIILDWKEIISDDKKARKEAENDD